MSIIIPSTSIYKIDNNKVIDNKINKISLLEQENSLEKGSIFSTNFDFWVSNGEGENLNVGDLGKQFFPYSSNDTRAYNNNISKNFIEPFSSSYFKPYFE